MQCPKTPGQDTQQLYPTPPSTITDFVSPRRRKLARKSGGKENGTEIFSDLQSSQSCEGLFKPGTVLQRRTATKYSNQSRPFTLMLDQGFNDDVFQSADAEHHRRTSVAAQFHDAARRLALSAVPTNLGNDSSSQRQLEQCTKRARSPSSYCRNFSRRTNLRSPSATPLHMTCVGERDITSARRENVCHNQYGCISPVTPSIRRFNLALSRSSKEYGVGSRSVQAVPFASRPRNFSRPQRPSQPSLLDSGKLYVHRTPTAMTSSTSVVLQTQDVEIAPVSSKRIEKDMKLSGQTFRSISKKPTPSTSHPGLRNEQFQAQLAEDQIRASFDSAVTEDLGDKCARLRHWEIWLQRILFTLFVFGVNIALGLAYLGSHKHPYLLAILAFMKSKDILSTIADIIGLVYRFLHNLIWPRPCPTAKWILSLVCAYAETEEQIMKTVLSLATSKTQPHKQVICIILDGKPRDIMSKMSEVKIAVQRPYTTWRSARGEIRLHGGRIANTPIILIEKIKNSGKKDSLILGHDLFNYPRGDMPQATKLLRQEIWGGVIPSILPGDEITGFDYIFCTDADSTIHESALNRLANALCCEINAVAACGILLAEFGNARAEFSLWHLFQQFQYTFGQYVRRQAESTWGRVTCLPGCITMIAVRPEMGHAISSYALPVAEHNIFRHQVQYLGTDRRLTWCMISQNKHLRTVFVPDALSETVVPNSLSHYLSQRRRWASNAYFNDFFYALGPQQRLITRLFALIDLLRLTLVFYRVFNTGYFLHGLITNFYIIKIIPTLIVTKTPATWYLLLIMCREPLLRKRFHKVILGMCINQVISPILSVIVFVNVLLHLGSQSWGTTGVSTQGPIRDPVVASSEHEKFTCSWTPKSLAKTVQRAVRGRRTESNLNPRARTSSTQNHENVAHDGRNEIASKSPQSQNEDQTSRNTPSMNEVESPVAVPMGSEICEETPNQSSAVYRETPLSLSRRTPRRRRQEHSTLGQIFETPTKMPPKTRFDFDFHES